ncbi:MAG: hydrophobic protein [Acidimicrobiales bacterium]
MVLLLALLLVLILFGAGFAVQLLWIAAVVFAVVWFVGFALGRGEGAGRHHFYRW